MADAALGAAASEAMLAEKEALARAITEALYAAMPHLLQKYGESGRAKCLQDMRYNLEHLAPAVALGKPALFASYVAWLRDMLSARGIPADEVYRSLELTQEIVRARLGGEKAEFIAQVIAAGLARLDEGSP